MRKFAANVVLTGNSDPSVDRNRALEEVSSSLTQKGIDASVYLSEDGVTGTVEIETREGIDQLRAALNGVFSIENIREDDDSEVRAMGVIVSSPYDSVPRE